MNKYQAKTSLVTISFKYNTPTTTRMHEDLEHWGELNNLYLDMSKTKLLIAGTRSKL